MKAITAIGAKLIPRRYGWSDSRDRFVFITKALDRRDRIANIRSVVADAVSFGFWSEDLYEAYIRAHLMPVRRRPDSGRDVLSDFELAYWVSTGCPTPIDLI